MLGGATMTRQQRERRQGSLRPSAVTIWAAMLLLAAVSSLAEGQQMPGSASVAMPVDAEVALRGQRAAVRNINYGDWRKFCFKAAGAKALCRTSITGTFETGQTAVRSILSSAKATAARGCNYSCPSACTCRPASS